MYRVVNNITDRELERIDSYEYWADANIESGKAFDIRDGDYEKLEVSIKELENDLRDAIALSGLNRHSNLTGCELAGGVCWSSKVIFEMLDICRMDYLDFSANRICNIAPFVLEHYQVPSDKIGLFRGSFYDTPFESNTFDFVVLCQALHHATDIDKLMSEIKRIIKENGKVIVIGEPKLNWFTSVIRYVKCVIRSVFYPNSRETMMFRKYKCLSSDAILGDHSYLIRGYKKLFEEYGFLYQRINSDKKKLGYILFNATTNNLI